MQGTLKKKYIYKQLFVCILIYLIQSIEAQDPVIFPGGGTGGGINTRNQNPNFNPLVFPREEKKPEIPCTTYNGEQGTCEILLDCATFYAEIAQLSRSPCKISEEQNGVCCPPSIVNGPSTVVAQPNIPIVFGPDMPINEVNHVCEESLWKVKDRMNFESDLVDRQIVAQKGSSVFMHARLFETSDEIASLGQNATLIKEATKRLATQFQLSKEQLKSGIPQVPVQNTIIASSCPKEPNCPVSRYRSIDGSCNNIQNKNWGKTGTAFIRYLSADYDDGLETIRRSAGRNFLPSARDISSSITEDIQNPYSNFTMLIMQWGQFLDHDITHTPISKGTNKADISCCSRGKLRQATDLHPECMPIPVSENDPFYRNFGLTCMEFVRSMPAVREDCTFGPREQMNQITAYIDASNVYGSTQETASKLRTFRNGLLKENARNNLLPGDPNSPGCNAPSTQKPCFLAGDSRVNEQPDLAVMHTVWMRQHNKIAKELAQLNPGWQNNDEILYQEARRIIIAQMQHITYNEYLPIVLGRNFMESFGLVPLKHGYSFSYNPEIHPGIHNAFAAAAFRYGHTLISGNLKGFGKFGNEETDLQLSKSQFAPFLLYENGKFDSLLRGLTRQRSEKFDHFFTEEITKRLFAQVLPFGMDLVALNIQRGRDHGLPSYNKWRALCELGELKSWNDLRLIMDARVVNQLQLLYESVDDIDFFIGGISERPVAGSLLGPTFLCIVGDQFARLKLGDRFFYENGNLESSFTPAQLSEIRKTSLARILCDNSDAIEMMQPLPLVTAHLANKRAWCESDSLIPRVDLRKWVNEPVWNK